MKTKSIDILVREALMDHGYPIHFYLPFLHHSLRCLENLIEDFNFGSNVKEVKLTVTGNKADIPANSVDVIEVFGVVGGERRSFYFNDSLVEVAKDSGVWTDGDNTLPEYTIGRGSSALLEQTSSNEYPTVYYPSRQVDYEYNIDLELGKIILGPRVNLSEIYVRYLNSSVSNSSANLVHPYATNVIIAYINWRHEEATGQALSRIDYKEKEYRNQKRLLRAKMNPLTIEQLYNILLTN